MKNKLKSLINLLLPAVMMLAIAGCSKLLDRQPITQVVTNTTSGASISASEAEG
jgi:hypothetical protein